jgi:hypothetical protein
MSFSSLDTLTALGILLLGLLVPEMGEAQPTDGATLEHVGRVTHPPVDEMSGIVRSPQFENVWWVHNDSGDEPRLFAVDSTGTVPLAPWRRDAYAVGAALDTTDRPAWPGLHLGAAAHVDYEDIAVEDSTLYLADIGNNGNARRDLGIYVIREPYYYARRTRLIKHIPVAYPDQDTFPATDWHFDAESIFVDDGTLYLLTKHRTGQDVTALEPGTKLYRLDSEHPHEVNILTLMDRHQSLPIPTAASLSPSGNRLAVLCDEGVWLFSRPEEGDRWLSTEPRRIELTPERLRQAEGITWDDPHTLRITNEQRDVFVLSLEQDQVP